MAKTAMKIKQQRKQKFSTREYTRCIYINCLHCYLFYHKSRLDI